MFDANIRFTDGNTRYQASDAPEEIIVWAARYGIALHYRRTAAPLDFTVTAVANTIESLDIYDHVR